jgi:hypothetical protein
VSNGDINDILGRRRVVVRNIGRANKPDDVSRITNLRAPVPPPIATATGDVITAPIPPGQFYTNDYAQRALGYRNVVGTTAQPLNWGGGTTVGLEIVNDSNNSVFVAFGGDTAAIQGNGPNFSGSHEVKPGERVSFAIHTSSGSVIATGPSSQIRVRTMLPT